jgi:cold shock CspA family protein
VKRRVIIATGQTGIVKWFDGVRLFGFIVPDNKAIVIDENKPDIFFHIRGVANGQKVSEGDRVTFDAAINPGKGLIALNVTPCDVLFMEKLP